MSNTEAAKEIKIDGYITVPQTLTHDEWWTKFIEWVETNRWSFGGTTGDSDENGYFI
jgi:hypothetical protein